MASGRGAGAPRRGRKKDIDRIMADHGIPYLATVAAGSLPLLKDGDILNIDVTPIVDGWHGGLRY